MMVTLTPREGQVKRLLGEGKTRKEIALALGIATNTAKVHIRNIYRRLGIHHRDELAP